jgi:hypothetical protein
MQNDLTSACWFSSEFLSRSCMYPSTNSFTLVFFTLHKICTSWRDNFFTWDKPLRLCNSEGHNFSAHALDSQIQWYLRLNKQERMILVDSNSNFASQLNFFIIEFFIWKLIFRETQINKSINLFCKSGHIVVWQTVYPHSLIFFIFFVNALIFEFMNYRPVIGRPQLCLKWFICRFPQTSIHMQVLRNLYFSKKILSNLSNGTFRVYSIFT